LYHRYVLPEVEVLLRVASAMTPQRCDAEDLVQETLIRAWRSIDRFDGRHPRAWLLTIMRNANANLHRRRRPHLLDDPDAPPAADRQRVAPSPESIVMSQTLDVSLEKALAKLPPQFQATVALVDVAGLTYAQAAAVLDVPRGTVMSRLHRARRRMKSQLKQAGVTVPEVDA
jgi:RNA polymerase sigma-70 factor (ECF subfamily)